MMPEPELICSIHAGPGQVPGSTPSPGGGATVPSAVCLKGGFHSLWFLDFVVINLLKLALCQLTTLAGLVVCLSGGEGSRARDRAHMWRSEEKMQS